MKNFTTPLGGRLVSGDVYKPQTKNMAGEALENPQYYVAVAIPKYVETHWRETEWGKIIYNVAREAFPQTHLSPKFFWKINDGDDQKLDKHGKRYCDRIGHAGHWIINAKNIFTPPVYTDNGTKQMLEKGYVKPGFYIQANVDVLGNGSQQYPGIYLNLKMICFNAPGKEIVYALDPTAVGFGTGGALPAEAGNLGETKSMQPVPVTPHTAILTPSIPAPPTPQHTMTSLANGYTRQQLLDAGWTDELLIQKGMMI